MADIPWTAEQLTEIVAAALKARDWKGVEAAIRLLVVVDPEQAEAVYDTIQIGLAARR